MGKCVNTYNGTVIPYGSVTEERKEICSQMICIGNKYSKKSGEE